MDDSYEDEDNVDSQSKTGKSQLPGRLSRFQKMNQSRSSGQYVHITPASLVLQTATPGAGLAWHSCLAALQLSSMQHATAMYIKFVCCLSHQG